MVRFKNLKNQKGFTLLEVLLVVAIIAILAGIVIIAINPSKQLGDSRNAQRKADVTTILNAVYQYSLDNNGVLPTGITTTATEICGTGVATCGALVDLSVTTASGKYLTKLPNDPQCPTGCTVVSTVTTGIGYRILKDANNRLTVSAPGTELGAPIISVTR